MDAVTEAALADPHGYLTYYKLRDAPFRTTADSRRLWLGGAHRALLETLTAAIRQGDGIVLLTGDTGTGKTSLVNWVIDILGRESLVIGRLPPFVFEVSELSQAVADAFGLEREVSQRRRLRDTLPRVPGRRSVARLEGAPRHRRGAGLGDELLRKVFDLSTIGTFEEHPFAILLAGQQELSAALSKDQHAGLRQRITTTCVLEPLTADEVGEYIQSRLHTAGSEEAIFAPDAVRQIASVSRGAPGLINVVCERALLAGYQRQARPIGSEIIDASLGGLGLGDGRAHGRRRTQEPQASKSPRAPCSRGAGAPDSERRSRSSCWAWQSSAPAATRCTWGGSAGRPATRSQSSTREPRGRTEHAARTARAMPVTSPTRGRHGKPAQIRTEPSALAPPVDGGPKLPPRRGDREHVRSAPAKAQAPVAAGRAEAAGDTTPRERARCPGAREADGYGRSRSDHRLVDERVRAAIGRRAHGGPLKYWPMLARRDELTKLPRGSGPDAIGARRRRRGRAAGAPRSVASAELSVVPAHHAGRA